MIRRQTRTNTLTDQGIARVVAKLNGTQPLTRRPGRARASYARAIAWLAENDDNGWLDEYEVGDGPISTTAHLVAELFNRHINTVARDLRSALNHSNRATP